METPDRKRQRAAIAPQEEGPSSTETPLLTTLPDELLVHIFRHMDSISRKRIERVCWRWKSLLREIASLHDHIKLDTSYLPLHFEWNDFGGVLRRFLDENPAALRIHLTESSPPKPGQWSNPWYYPQENAFFSNDSVLYELGTQINMHSYVTHPCCPSRPVHVLFEKVTMEMKSIEEYLLSHSEYSLPGRLEFRDVLVKRISLQPLLDQVWEPQLEYPFYGEWVEEERRVTGFIDPGKDEPKGYVALMALLGQNDPSLTVDEKRLFRRIIGAVEKERGSGAAYYLEILISDITGKWMDPEDAVTEPAVTPLMKRLIIGARDVLDYLDLHSQPIDDDDEEDDEDDDEDGEE